MSSLDVSPLQNGGGVHVAVGIGHNLWCRIRLIQGAPFRTKPNGALHVMVLLIYVIACAGATVAADEGPGACV